MYLKVDRSLELGLPGLIDHGLVSLKGATTSHKALPRSGEVPTPFRLASNWCIREIEVLKDPKHPCWQVFKGQCKPVIGSRPTCMRLNLTGYSRCQDGILEV